MKRRRILAVVGVLAVALVAVLFFPIMQKPVEYQSKPISSYEEAVRQIREEIAHSPPEVSELGRTKLLDHGHATKKVFVLMHGLSNCPEQFLPLGKLLFDRGCNVLIPRTPYHGESDRLTTSFANLTAQDMVEMGNKAADQAHGLGEEVIVVGLSINGTTAAWMAQNRPDLKRVVLMAPFLAPAIIPKWAKGPPERLLLRMPNHFFWWNPKLKEKLPGPTYSYPRFPTKVVGQVMLLGSEVLSQAEKTKPACGNILVITTACDMAASKSFTDELVADWRRFEKVETYEFPADQKVPHDFIDPNQIDQQTAIVYPKLLELLEQ